MEGQNFQLVWRKHNELFHSRTTGNEQVTEIQARNEDYEGWMDLLFLFLYFTKG